VQDQAGERDIADRNGQMLASAIPAAAGEFLGRQRLVFVARVDGDGRPWASGAEGVEGFIRVVDGTHLEIDTTSASTPLGDPVWDEIKPHDALGMLFLEPATRRRFRVNGRAIHAPPRLTLKVREAYPNCRKYIQLHTHDDAIPETGVRMEGARRGVVLEAAHRRWIRGAGTTFVASDHPERGPDISHRGGEPGFMTFLNQRTLLIPDYPGNSLFNTLGNLMVRPVAGLLIPDFSSGRALHLTGEARVLFDSERPDWESGGTGRYWSLEVSEWVETSMIPRYRWIPGERSPHNPRGPVEG